ncbi:MAG: hypothetical protein AB7F59_04255 [Bdellovibrionales bacterium]
MTQEKKTDIFQKTGHVIQETTNQVSQTLSETRALRGGANYYLLASYSLIDLIIPIKCGGWPT